MKIVEKKIQEAIPQEQGGITLGNFVLAENESFYHFLTHCLESNKDFVPLSTFYSYFGRTIRKPIKIEYDHSPSDTQITKELVQTLYREHQANKGYDKRYEEYIKQATLQRDITTQYEKNYTSYIKYLTQKTSISKDFFDKKRPNTIPKSDKHTYITGATGYGKSETVKLLIHHYLNQDEAIIFFDPHGDIAREVAQFKENIESDKLVYIKPKLSTKLSPKFNPLEFPKTEDKELYEEMISDASETFLEIMKEVFTAQELSENMTTVLKNCFMVLAQMPNTNIFDILHFMEKKNKEKYISFANENINDATVLFFLRSKLYNDDMKPTREAIRSRFFNLLQYRTLYKTVVGKESFNLTELIEQKKIIIFDLSGMNKLPRNLLGKFLIAQIRLIGLARTQIPPSQRTPCHIFIDECQLFITESLGEILRELRKYKIYLTLAQQNVGHNMSSELKKSVLTNTGIKMVGHSTTGDLKTMADEIGVSLKEIQDLKKGEFYVKAENNIPIKTKMLSHLVEDRHSMNEKDWQKIEFVQKQKYYSEIEEIKLEDTKEVGEYKDPAHNRKPPVAS